MTIDTVVEACLSEFQSLHVIGSIHHEGLREALRGILKKHMTAAMWHSSDMSADWSGTGDGPLWLSGCLRYTPQPEAFPEDRSAEARLRGILQWFPIKALGKSEGDFIKVSFEDDTLRVETGAAPAPAKVQWEDLLASHNRLLHVVELLEYSMVDYRDEPSRCPECNGSRPQTPAQKGQGHDSGCPVYLSLLFAQNLKTTWPKMFPESGNPTVPA